MSDWPPVKAKKLLAALASIVWSIKPQSGSHRTLYRPGYPDFVFAFHEGEEIGPRMLTRIAKHTGLQLVDL
ncbi:MAG: type II toxin-antitoxin system HicA family toxin [Desulfomonilaceae bacterium]